MIRLPICLFLTVLSMFSIAQEVSGDDARFDILAERSRIQLERSVGESLFKQQEAACYAKFTVTDCLLKVRLNRRQLSDDLNSQTVLLNDLERKRKILAKKLRNELK